MATGRILDQHGRKMAYVGQFYRGADPYQRERRPIPTWSSGNNGVQDEYSRSNAMAISRYLYANVGFVAGAVDSMAVYSVGTGLMPQSMVSSRKTADLYESYWTEWGKICDATGRFSIQQFQRMASTSIDIDGGIGFQMVKTDTGWPQLLAIRMNRVGSLTGNDARNHGGVYVDSHGRVTGYGIREQDGEGRRIDPADFIHVYEPKSVDDYRGMPSLTHGLNDVRDIDDLLEYTKIACKAESVMGMIIQTASGEVDDAMSVIENGYQKGNTPDLPWETLKPGMIPRLKEGEDIRSFVSNRPSPTFTGFVDYLIRNVSAGMGLPYEFIWNANAVGGAGLRSILARAQRRFEMRQEVLKTRMLNRLWFWVISNGIKRGDLPKDMEPWRVRWQCPARLTVDFGRESRSNLDELKAGNRSLAEDTGERGEDWQELRDQIEIETRDLLDRAKSISGGYDLSMREAITLLRDTGSQQMVAAEKTAAAQVTADASMDNTDNPKFQTDGGADK